MVSSQMVAISTRRGHLSFSPILGLQSRAVAISGGRVAIWSADHSSKLAVGPQRPQNVVLGTMDNPLPNFNPDRHSFRLPRR